MHTAKFRPYGWTYHFHYPHISRFAPKYCTQDTRPAVKPQRSSKLQLDHLTGLNACALVARLHEHVKNTPREKLHNKWTTYFSAAIGKGAVSPRKEAAVRHAIIVCSQRASANKHSCSACGRRLEACMHKTQQNVNLTTSRRRTRTLKTKIAMHSNIPNLEHLHIHGERHTLTPATLFYKAAVPHSA